MKKCLCWRYVSEVVHGSKVWYWTHSFGYEVKVPGIIGDFYALHMYALHMGEDSYRWWYICERTTGAGLNANHVKTLTEAIAEAAKYIEAHGGQERLDQRVQQVIAEHGLPPDLDLDAEEEELI